LSVIAPAKLSGVAVRAGESGLLQVVVEDPSLIPLVVEEILSREKRTGIKPLLVVEQNSEYSVEITRRASKLGVGVIRASELGAVLKSYAWISGRALVLVVWHALSVGEVLELTRVAARNRVYLVTLNLKEIPGEALYVKRGEALQHFKPC